MVFAIPTNARQRLLLREGWPVSVEAEVGLHAFKGLAFGFGVEEEDGEELYGHHGCEEGEGECLRVDRYQGESVRDDSVGDPVGRGA